MYVEANRYCVVVCCCCCCRCWLLSPGKAFKFAGRVLRMVDQAKLHEKLEQAAGSRIYDWAWSVAQAASEGATDEQLGTALSDKATSFAQQMLLVQQLEGGSAGVGKAATGGYSGAAAGAPAAGAAPPAAPKARAPPTAQQLAARKQITTCNVCHQFGHWSKDVDANGIPICHVARLQRQQQQGVLPLPAPPLPM